jgi:hypothetical protein
VSSSADISGGDDLWLLSQDIDLAMEQFVSLSNDSTHTVKAREEFLPEKLLTDHLRVDDGRYITGTHP